MDNREFLAVLAMLFALAVSLIICSESLSSRIDALSSNVANLQRDMRQ